MALKKTGVESNACSYAKSKCLDETLSHPRASVPNSLQWRRTVRQQHCSGSVDQPDDFQRKIILLLSSRSLLISPASWKLYHRLLIAPRARECGQRQLEPIAHHFLQSKAALPNTRLRVCYVEQHRNLSTTSTDCTASHIVDPSQAVVKPATRRKSSGWSGKNTNWSKGFQAKVK